MNILVVINLIIMITQIVLMSQIGSRAWLYNNIEDHWYLFPKDVNEDIDKELTVFKAFMSFYLLFDQLIPLDLAVNLILVKIFYTLLIEADETMIDLQRSIDRGGQLVGCSVRNMTKLEDIANITHVFCDKTGTLTQNELVFRALSFGSKVFRVGNDEKAMAKYEEEITEFWQSQADTGDSQA